MLSIRHLFSGRNMFDKRGGPPFSLSTLQNDPNCVLIQDPSQVWGLQDFPPSSYSSDNKLAWGATKNVDWVQRNALSYTEDLTNAAWTKISTSAPSAGVLQCSAATATHEFRSTTGPITPVVGQTYYLSCKAKQGTSPYVQLACFSGMHATAYANFDLSSGSAGTGASCTPTITGPDADGYYTISIAVVATGTPAASGFRLSIQQSASDTRQQSWAAAGTETVNIKNIGLYVGSLPSYQAIGSDWDTTYTANAIAAGYPIALWQDSAGTKAVNADNQAIGACRDLKYGDYGPNLVSNGTFDSVTTGWTAAQASLAVVNGELEITASNTNYPLAKQAVATVIGSAYVLTATRRKGTASLAGMQAGTSDGGSQFGYTEITSSSNVVSSLIFRATGTTSHITLYGQNNAAGTTSYFDNISVREIPGYTAIQATTANQPKWRLDANGKPYIERDLNNDSLPITLPNLGSQCVIYTAEGNVTLKDSGITLNGSYAPITPAADYGRIIMAADSRYDAKIVKYLDGKRGRGPYALGPEKWSDAATIFGGLSSKISTGVYRVYSSDGTNSYVYVSGILTTGKSYLATVTVTNIAVLGTGIQFGDSGPKITAIGSYSVIYVAEASGHAFIKRQGSACDFTITGVSFREVILS